MSLSYERLIEFDLVKNAEAELTKDSGRFVSFITLINEIKGLDQFIKETPSYPGSTDKIIRDEMLAGIGATLAIEGTNIGKEEMEVSFKKARLKDKLMQKELEADNSRKVYEFIFELEKKSKGDFTLSEAIIRQIHTYFTRGIDYISNTPGEYRGDFPATFGEPRRKGLCRTRAEIQQAMANFIKWVNDSNSGLLENDKVIKAIMAHYYLTEIHPFGDGNGRTARAVEALLLYHNGINDYCFWSLANFWSVNRAKYLVHLGDIYQTLNPLQFIEWGINGYRDELVRIKEKVLKKIKQLMLLDYARHLLSTKRRQKIKISTRVVDVLRILTKKGKARMDKFVDSPEVTGLFRSVSGTTKYRDMKKMVELNLITVTEGEGEKNIFIEPNYEILESLRYNI